MSNRVLVTGGSGFVGSRLVKKLLAMGFEVGVTVRVDHAPDNWRLKSVWDQLAVLEMDIRNRESVRQIVRYRPIATFHLAAYHHVGRSWDAVEECFDVNAKGSANVIDAALQCSSQLIYMSSSEVYGEQQEVPWMELNRPNPSSPYAVTKYAGELYAAMVERKAGLKKVNIARPFNVFGPGQSDRAVIGEFIKLALQNKPIHMTEGKQTREFNYVDNIVEGLIMLWQRNPGVGPYNIACGEDHSILEVAKKIVAMTESESEIVADQPYRPNEIWEMRADPTLFREITGWKPVVNFSEGLRRTINWYREKLEEV